MLRSKPSVASMFSLALRSEMFPLIVIFTVTCLGLPASEAGVVRGDGPTVVTPNGPIEGLYLDEANVFFGIPYAVPPVGDRRWRDPVPAKSWKPDVYKAVKPPPGCYQHCGTPPHTCPATVSEDCLYLTVFTPRSATTGSNFPVMLFLHGGNFVEGSGYSDLTDGRYYANKTDTISVLINYRLGAFGFLVTGNGSEDATGNYGILDQRLALEWVQTNIASFGGDPNRVTLFGQSAGSQSVAVHVTSKRSQNLFHRAIIESFPFSVPFKKYFEAVILGNDFAEALNCSHGDLKCMRTKSPADVKGAQDKVGGVIINPLRLFEMFEQWGPYIDGRDITKQSVDAFMSGDFQKMPIIIGSTSDEARINVIGAFPKPMDVLQVYEYLLALFPTHFFQVMAEYPPDPPGSDQREPMIVAANHVVFVCPERAALRGIAKYGDGNVWMYLFDHILSFDAWGPHWQFCVNHSCHGAELAFLFHSAPLGGFKYTADEDVLSRSMVYYWSNMAHTGNPNDDTWRRNNPRSDSVGEFVEWPKYGNSTGWSYMHLMTPRDRADKNYLQEKCDFWDSLDVYPR
ncbi:cAMP-regulated D2 protein-like [Ptychodera flava]|uniref:cAMP-regulated D2 protein-like n=1 Tax=Ptychodera flava TaxID=63121 RepID=UPI003969FE46